MKIILHHLNLLVISCRVRLYKLLPNRAKQVVSCPPDGLPVKLKHSPTHALSQPRPVICRAMLISVQIVRAAYRPI
jgi:hypothetical protein